jgi:hypothetical protein
MVFIDRLLGYLHLARVSPTTALVLTPAPPCGLWERHVNEDDALLGWKFTCTCGWSCNRPANELERNKVHECPQCHVRFNLNQSLVLNGSTTKLVKREKPQRTMQAVGDEPVKVVWSGKPDGALQKAYESGDPGNIPGSLF